MTDTARPTLLLVFYGNPDQMPMIFKEALVLRERFSVHIICLHGGPDSVEWSGVEIERIRPRFAHLGVKLANRIAANFDYVNFVRIVRRRIKELRPDVLYVHDARAMVAARLANLGLGVPVIYRCHDIYEDLQPWHSLHGYLERHAARAGLNVRLVIQYSEGRAQHFRKITKSSYANMLVAPNYASLRTQPSRACLDDLIAKRFAQKLVVYPGVIQERVAIEDLIKAIALLPAGWSTSMFGDSEETRLREAMQLATDLGLGARLRHGGWLPPAQALAATNLGTVGVVLFKPVSVNYATMATSSNKLWEFAARGIPVMVPDTEDYRNVLGNEAWIGFFKIGDPDDLAAGITRLTSSFDAYRAASIAAYEGVSAKYNFEKLFPPVLDALLDAAGIASCDSHPSH